MEENLETIVEEEISNLNLNADVDADSGVDESTQGKDSAEISSPRKSHSRIPKKTPPASPLKRSRQMAEGRPRMPRSKSVPKPAFSTFSTPPSTSDSIKKIPMNRIVVGNAPSPNLKKVQSRVGSLANSSHKAGGGNVKIESRKLDWKAAPKTVVVNEKYVPGGGDKKIESKKLVWNAQSKVGSLNNTSHKAGGGDKKIESQKLDWKKTSKVGSTANITHKAGGGNVKIHDTRMKIEGSSRIGSLQNVKHRPGGGDKKIFDDKDYIRQVTETQSQSGPQSLNGSIMGSSAQFHNESGSQSLDYAPLSYGKHKQPEDESNSSYQFTMQRKMSPMGGGF